MEFNSNDLKKSDNKQELIIKQNIELQHEILCSHCKRTKYNETSCLGICVADNDY